MDPAVDRPDGVVAFVFTDVEDSTSRWEHESDAMRSAVARHFALIDAITARHRGTRAVEQGAGDSTVLAFHRPSDALRAAIDLQLAMTEEPWPTADGLRVRVAVHAGEVQVNGDGTYAGPTMNRCGRLLGAAHGGQIVASMTTIDLAGDWTTADADAGTDADVIDVLDLGTHRLRGIDQVVRIAQIHHARLPRDFPPLRTRNAAAASLPRYDSAFVGRAVELDELDALVRAGGLVTLVGTGGCGKTRLATEVAGRSIEHFRDGIVWVDLASVGDGARVDDAAAAALGLRSGTGRDRDRVVDHLRGRHTLVAVDNCEHLIDDAAALIVAVRDACPQVTVLATSREPLNVSEEVVRRVPSLPLPAAASTEAIENSDAGRLMLDRIRRVRPQFTLINDDDVRAVHEICCRLDGIPLALELAASRLRALPAAAVAGGLAERFQLLTGGGRNVLARQRTMEASVAWSHQLLTEAEATTFRRLSVFASPFTLDAAVHVAGDGVSARHDPADTVVRLVDRSLLHEVPGGAGRLRMLETIRHFARERLVESGEAGDTRDRHLQWFVHQASVAEAGLEGPDASDVMVALDGMIDDLRAAMRWAADTSGGDDLLAIIAPTAWYWILRGGVAEAKGWIALSEHTSMEVAPAWRLRGLWAMEQLLIHHDARHAEMAVVADAAFALARELGDRVIEGRLLVSWGMHLGFRAPAQSMEMIEEGRRLCVEEGEPFWAAYADGSIALCQVFLGREDLADASLSQMAARRRQHPSTRLLADELARRVFVDYALGRYDAVLAGAAEVEQVLGGISDINVQGVGAIVAGRVRIERGEAEHVAPDMERLLDRYLREKEYQHVPLIVLTLARASIAAGRTDDALAAMSAVWSSPDLQAFVAARLWFRHELALAQVAAGRVDDALTGFGELLADATAEDNPHERGHAMWWLGVLERSAGRHAAAEGHLHDALSMWTPLGYRQLVASALEAIAGLELDHDRPAVSARLMGAAASVRAEAGVTYRVGWQDTYDADMAALRAAVPGEELETEWQRGLATNLDDAVALAQRGRGERGRPTFGWDSLTATEQRVAKLVAHGSTNAQIAEELIMGRETVKTHVSSILRKLSLTNRTQIASSAAARASDPEAVA